MKNVLVSGASRGIGRAISVRLASLGYNLYLLGRDEDALADVKTECESHDVSAGLLAGDIRDTGYLDTAIDQANAALGSIDVLVNNAGIANRAAIQDADLSEWQSVLEVNFESPLRLCRTVLPPMIERKSGAIINISSISGRNTDPGSGIYAATKHAINGLSGCMFEDVRDYGIKVTSIMPGFVDTNLTASMAKDHNKMIQATDIADAVEYVLNSSATCCPTEIVLRPQLRP